MEDLILTGTVGAEIIRHAREGYPLEVCGLVAGHDGRGLAVHRGQNVAPRPEVAFELDAETLALQIAFEEQGLALVAIYHSHPQGPAAPSTTDVSQAFYPDAVQIICSLARPEAPVLRGFRIVQGRVWEVRLRQGIDIPGTIG
ncbi:MAG TPA: M67 family metallopeptidase [Anaerolineae bacterium]